MDHVTIYTALEPADAQLVRSSLEAAGFHPFVADENSAIYLGGGTAATQGIRVQVPDPEAAEAREFLKTAHPIPPEIP